MASCQPRLPRDRDYNKPQSRPGPIAWPRHKPGWLRATGVPAEPAPLAKTNARPSHDCQARVWPWVCKRNEGRAPGATATQFETKRWTTDRRAKSDWDWSWWKHPGQL